MNLLFRVLWVMLAALLGRRLGVMDESRVPLRVLPTDLDLNIHMTNARYLSMMDLGRLDMLIRSGLGRAMLRNRWQTVLGASTIRFRRPLRPFQRFDVVSRVLCWDERWFYIEHRIESGAETAAVAVMQGVFLARGKVIPPADVLGALGAPSTSPPVPDHVAAWRPQTLPVERAAA